MHVGEFSVIRTARSPAEPPAHTHRPGPLRCRRQIFAATRNRPLQAIAVGIFRNILALACRAARRIADAAVMKAGQYEEPALKHPSMIAPVHERAAKAHGKVTW